MDNSTYQVWRDGALQYASSQLDTEGLRLAYGDLFGVLE
jgi:hypothetical protein